MLQEELKKLRYQSYTVLLNGRKTAENLYVNYPQTSSRERYQR
jgi:hypothetical protein